MQHISKEQFEQQLSYITAAPKNHGRLKMIVVRPRTNERQILHTCELSLKGGAHGDMWASGTWKSLPDGSPHPDVQLTLMNYRVLEAIADTDEQRALAGDNLCLDFNLSSENLTCGDRLQIGDSVVIEVTDVPHDGCHKFKKRFGIAALSYINSAQGKALHLRGIYAKVIVDGIVNIGDTIRKMNGEG
ncbi:MAG: MOSC domain-containing protein [Leptolyngbyaceae cyanobacterium]